MSNLKDYRFTATARRGTGAETKAVARAFSIRASCEGEAALAATESLRREFPVSLGYYDHNAVRIAGDAEREKAFDALLEAVGEMVGAGRAEEGKPVPLGKTFQITNGDGRKFNVKIVAEGDRYGVRGNMIGRDTTEKVYLYAEGGCPEFNADDVLVEFYDATHAGQEGFDEEGQFVTRYCASTLLSRPAYHRGAGLNMMGHEPLWQLDGTAFDEAMGFVKAWIGASGLQIREGWKW